MANYYVDYDKGDDSNPGTIDLPWKTTHRVNGGTYASGDFVYFKTGQTWRGTLVAQSNVEFNLYGSGNKPKINAGIPKTSANDWTSLGGNLWRTSLKYYIPTANPVNLLSQNASSFDTSFDTGEWGYSNGGTANAFPTRDTNAANYTSAPAGVKIGFSNAGSSQGDIKFYKKNISLVAGGVYELQFDIRADANLTLAPDISLKKQTTPFTDYYSYREGNQPTVTTTFATKTMRFVANKTATDAYILFQFGNCGATAIYMDNVSWKLVGVEAMYTSQIGFMATPDYSTILGELVANTGLCTANGQFTCDTTNYTVTMYCDQNPFLKYGALELAANIQSAKFYNVTNARIYNFELFNSGNGGSGFELSTNCYFMSNKVHHMGGFYVYGTTRGGNGFTFWLTNTNCHADANEFYQCYDVGVSPQGTQAFTMTNCSANDNYIHDNEQSLEFWGKPATGTASFVNFEMKRNKCTRAGKGWSHSIRPDKTVCCHVLMYQNTATISGFYLTENIFDEAEGYIYRISESFVDIDKITVDNNIIRQSAQKKLARKTDYVSFDMGQIRNYQEEWGWDLNSKFMLSENTPSLIDSQVA